MSKTLIIAILINSVLSAVLTQFSVNYALCLWLGEILGAIFIAVRLAEYKT